MIILTNKQFESLYYKIISHDPYIAVVHAFVRFKTDEERIAYFDGTFRGWGFRHIELEYDMNKGRLEI